MTAFTLSAFAADFHGTAVKIIDHAGQRWLTAADVGRCLGYAADTARQAIIKLYNRHADEFTEEDTFEVKLTSNSPGNPNTRIFSATGCVKLGFFANTSLAKAFRAWASKVLAAHLEAAPAPRDSRGGRAATITRAVELQVLQLFVAGHSQRVIAHQTGVSPGAVNLMLHGRYRFSPGAGVDLTTPELLAAVAQRHVQTDLARLTRKYCASAANQGLEHALDDAGQRLLADLSA